MKKRKVYTIILVMINLIIGMILGSYLEGEEKPTVASPEDYLNDTIANGYYETEQVEIYKP